MIRKAIFILIPLFALCICLSVLSTDVACAYSEADFYLKTFTPVSSAVYYNATDGCTYRVPVSMPAYEGIVRVEYDMVRLKGGVNEQIELDEMHKATGYEYINDEPVVVNKAELIEYGEKTYARDHYFTVTAHEQCAFIFTVYYNGAEGVTPAYGSDILMCNRIDFSKPEAYFDTWVYDSGNYVLSVVIKGNRRAEPLSADSGLKELTVIRRVGSVDTEIDKKTISGTTYNYQLECNKSKAVYFFKVEDSVGNKDTIKIIEFDKITYDAGFESAATNEIDAFDTATYSEFSDGVKRSLIDAYYDYYLAIQGDVDANAAIISEKMATVRSILGYLASLRALQSEGKKEYAISSSFDKEYFGGEITLSNQADACADQKYGEVADLYLSVAKVDAPDVVKTYVKKSRFDVTYAIDLSMDMDGTKKDETFATPLKIRIPTKLKNVTAAQNSATFGVGSCEVVYGSNYTEISVPYSDGTIFLMIGEKFDLNYLWILTAIPVVAAGVIVAVALIKKKKKTPRKRKANKFCKRSRS